MVRAAPGTALRAEHALAPFARESERRELKRWTLALDDERASQAPALRCRFAGECERAAALGPGRSQLVRGERLTSELGDTRLRT
jgi:hypothetical protein